MKVVSPSYKRAGAVEVRKWNPNAILAVHKFEADEYRAKEGGELLVLSDDSRGNMAKVRNEILEAMPFDEWFVQMDDDVTEVGYFGRATDDDNHVRYSLGEFEWMLELGSMMADEVGTALWGFNVTYDPRFYREYSPLSFQNPVLGTFCVMKRTTGIDYDERLSLNEDYDIFLQYLKRFRRVLRFDRNYYIAGHLTQDGGCSAYRVIDEERRQAGILERKWGKDIVKFKLERSTNPRIISPIPGA